MKITHLGGESTVTGSCHLVQARGVAILIDCGLAQGSDAVSPMDDWPAAPSDIDFVFLTHAHIDHIGRVPELIQKGFSGEIIATHPTKALLLPMLDDAMGFSDLSKKEADRICRKIDEAAWGFETNRAFDLAKGIRFTLGRAGHILGSCWVQIDIPEEGRVIFSGDLGSRDTPILCDPDIPEGCDLLVMESTYGDRLHGNRKDRQKRLGQVLDHVLADGGKVFIPAFALGRTQELIYEMDRLFEKGLDKVPVFVDSPLGLAITEIYSSLSQYWDKEARKIAERGDHPIDFRGLYAVRRHSDHLALCDAAGPMVILAGSGMCTGGRILDHLRKGIEDPKNDILFVGYQAAGTPGRDIVTYGKKPGGHVMLDGERLDIRAAVHQMGGYSAHADQEGLVSWVDAMAERPKEIKLVHGEAGARVSLERLLASG
ncbi:MAG: MBL fold metallo-hydrolase [Desulfobacterales bacterium]|nr:MBL fold metallo-hydrolase [Desulfobacterales bacterium]